MADKPFQLNDTKSSSGRDTLGRFARPDAVPAKPTNESVPSTNDQQTMSGWAPRIGQNSAVIRQQMKPFQPIAKPQTGFKVK